MRIAAAVAWEKISLLVLTLSFLDRRYCSSVIAAAPGVTAARAVAVAAAAAAAGVAAAQAGGGPQESIRPGRWWRKCL